MSTRFALRNRRRRGFTLTELMVSLVMGLIIALAAVGLARTATTTFHEQARTSQTEMSIRTATERLKLDLMRVSYMSTGNIALDPKVSAMNGATTPAAIARYPETTALRGISIDPGMLVNGGVPAPIAANGLTPDAIDLVGNFATDDSYTGVIAMGAGSAPAGNCQNPQVITLDPNADAATYQLGGGTGTTTFDPTVLATNAKAAFLPTGATKMLAQVTDAIGCANYVPVCAVNVSGGLLQVVVDGNSNTRAVLYSNSSGYENPPGLQHSCGASENGKVSIAPLQHIKWLLAATKPGLESDPALGEDTPKTDLVREVLDFGGNVIATETIAEYAVDLKFGITYDDPTAGVTGTARQVVLDLDTDNGNGNIFAVTAGPNSTVLNSPGPHRVRSVKFRIAVRTAIADRDSDLNISAGNFRARYCVATSGGGTASCTKWARVRTDVSEVGLTNQARMSWGTTANP